MSIRTSPASTSQDVQRTQAGHFLIRGEMDLKDTKSTEELIELLEKRGLTIDSPLNAKIYLEENGYYHLNIYFHKNMMFERDDTGKMKRLDRFNEGTTFERIIQAHENDRWLRNEIFGIIEPIEIKLRSVLAHNLGLKYSSSAFYEPEAFEDHGKWLELLTRFTKEIEIRCEDPIVQTHLEKYDEKFHIWAVTELISFNLLVKLYTALHHDDKKAIAIELNNPPARFFESWLISISDLRNICAHHKFLYRRIYDHYPRLIAQFNWEAEQNKKLFAIMLVIREISAKNKFNERVERIYLRDTASPFLNYSDYGFPPDWAERLFID